jgi:hypothetical protein
VASYGCPADIEKDDAIKGGRRDATPDLLVKHSNTTVAAYV